MSSAGPWWTLTTRHGERPAVVDSAGTHSYPALWDRSRAIASGILAGLADLAGARVAFLVAPGMDHVATQWAIWRAGGIAVPLAASHPPAELEYVLEDADPALVVADHPAAPRLEPLARRRSLRFARTDDLAAPIVGELPSVTPHRPAMMIYTSGTTGRAKGVITTHANIDAQIRTLVDAWGWSPSDRVLHVLPLHHVHGVVNVLSCALWIGGCVEFLAFDPGIVWDRLASGSISLFMAVPTIYHRLIVAWDEASATTRTAWSEGAARLRLMVSGSAALPVVTLDRWREITGHTLLERYGMTEIGMALSNPVVGERRPGTVGLPLPGVEVRLVDERGREVAQGQGEIEVRSPQIFLEYWRRPQATREAFREGWFRTGDLAARDETGYYRILGRLSIDIIKSAGYKISALEIEEVLREHPSVRDCAVIGIPDPDLGEKVAAVVVPIGVDPDRDQLRAWAKTRMAPYKVPREIRILPELPRNAMGKVTKPELRTLFG